MKPDTGAWVSYDGQGWCIFSTEGVFQSMYCVEGALLPDIGESIDGLFWPIERLMVRSFQLPLGHPRFIDAEIIGQELAEQASEDPADWWLTWQASISEEGVAGTWFALPEAVRVAVDSDAIWKEIPRLIVDATARLGAWIDAAGGSASDGPLAVFDMDADGLFLGFYQEKRWQGMRRLNGGYPQWNDMALEAGRSLAAMGWRAGEHGAIGRLPLSFASAIGIQHWQGQNCEPEELPGRHAANLALSGKLPTTSVNLRHGSWAVQRRVQRGGAWRRPLAMVAALLLIWIMGNLLNLYRLSHNEDHYRQQIADAFHRGLPHETVMLDALAQLRKAAGGSFDSGSDNGKWIRQLRAVALAYRLHPWQMHELDFDSSGVHMSGMVQGLNSLSLIRKDLSAHLGHDVKLVDTDLHGKSVNFRLAW